MCILLLKRHLFTLLFCIFALCFLSSVRSKRRSLWRIEFAHCMLHLMAPHIYLSRARREKMLSSSLHQIALDICCTLCWILCSHLKELSKAVFTKYSYPPSSQILTLDRFYNNYLGNQRLETRALCCLLSLVKNTKDCRNKEERCNFTYLPIFYSELLM